MSDPVPPSSRHIGLDGLYVNAHMIFAMQIFRGSKQGMASSEQVTNKAVECLADALAVALAGKPTDARAIVTHYLATTPELRSLPELGKRLAEFGLAPDAIDYDHMPAEARAFVAGLGDPPGGPQYVAGIRVALGLSQSQLGEKLGVSYATVSKWERGTVRIPADVMHKLITLFGEGMQRAAPKPFTASEIRAIRRRLGFTEKQLGEAVGGAAQALVSQWENRGHAPSAKYHRGLELLLSEKGISRDTLTSDAA